MNIVATVFYTVSAVLALVSMRLSRKADEKNKEILRSLSYYKDLSADLRDEADALHKLLDCRNSLPDGCKNGNWCSVCVYGKEITEYYTKMRIPASTTVCMHGACEKFTVKEE